MQMSSGKRRRLVAEINVVPYIDVMLVLLVVFMITAPMLIQGVDVELPAAPSQPLPESELEPMIISIKQDGGFFIDLGDDADQPRTLDQIIAIISSVVEENPNTPILVWGDRRVAYGEVVNLMSELQSIGSIRVGLVTEPPALGE